MNQVSLDWIFLGLAFKDSVIISRFGRQLSGKSVVDEDGGVNMGQDLKGVLGCVLYFRDGFHDCQVML